MMKSNTINLKENEHLVLELDFFELLDINLSENCSLTLNLLKGKNSKEIDIQAKLSSNSELNINCADVTNSDTNLNCDVYLNNELAKFNWNLSCLGQDKNKKNHNVKVHHISKNTIADITNYGVSKESSKIIFEGYNKIYENATSSKTKQDSKIIVFDNNSYGRADPKLLVDNNDVVASHSASIGQLNEDHLYYLMSRGLSRDQSRSLITLGYLKPICDHFSSDKKKEIEDIILGVI